MAHMLPPELNMYLTQNQGRGEHMYSRGCLTAISRSYIAPQKCSYEGVKYSVNEYSNESSLKKEKACVNFVQMRFLN